MLILAQMDSGPLKPLVWIGSSYRDLRKLSDRVQDNIGYAIYFAQIGKRHPSAKVLKVSAVLVSWRLWRTISAELTVLFTQ